MSTLPTPLIGSICRLICLSAMSVTSRRERGAETAMRRTGVASVSSFWTIGISAVSGSSLTIRSTLLRTSWAATSAFFSSRNVIKTCDTPSTEVDRSSSMLLIVLTALSTLSVISVSTSCGDAPGLTTVTVIVGRSIFGKRSTPSERYEKTPTTVMLRMSIVANTGRRTQISASFCMTFFRSADILSAVREHPARITHSLPRAVQHLLPHSDSIIQLIDITRRHDFISSDPTLDLDQIAFGLTSLDQPLLREAVLEYIHVGRTRDRAQRALRDEHCRFALRQKHAHGCELLRLQFGIWILDVSFHGQSSRCAIEARRNARHMTRETSIRIRCYADGNALADANLRNRLLRHIDADAQRIQVHDRRDLLLRRNVLTNIGGPI